MEELKNEEGSINIFADRISRYRLNEIVEVSAGIDAVETFLDPENENDEDEEE